MDEIVAKVGRMAATAELLLSVNELLKARPRNQDLLDTKADLEKDLARERRKE